MTFREKSNALMLVALVAVYSGHFWLTLQAALAGDAVLDTVLLLKTGTVLVLIAIAGHVVIGVMSADKNAPIGDERDEMIDLRGDRRAGYVLGFFAFTALALAIFEQSVFWIANSILFGLVIAEVVKGISKLVEYRRGVV
ncbi:hypothetical protein [Maricaulis sp. CAU 1757]